MKVRFQADADLNEDIVTGILRREPAVDFQTATAAGLRLLSDLDVLTLAAPKVVFWSSTIAEPCHGPSQDL